MAAFSTIPIAQAQIDPEVIDLGVGQPDPALLPLESLHRASEIRFAAGDRLFLQYGFEQGDGYLRMALAKFLSEGYGFPVDSAELLITSGASAAMDLICTLFTRPGDTIFVEEPTYHMMLHLFSDHHLNPIGIPVDEHGLVIEALEDALKWNHPVFTYTIPSYQNPGGVTLSDERRQRLADLSRAHGFMIVADEVYHFLNFSSLPPLAMAGWIGQGNVLSIGSFSKILAPGLRLGWIQAGPELIRTLSGSGLLDSGGGMNPFTSAIVRGVIENGDLQQHIGELRRVYSGRVKVMEAALRLEIPEAAFSTPQGGYFFWVHLLGGASVTGIQARLDAEKISLRSGERFSSQGKFGEYARLCFAYYQAAEIEEGIRRLGRALRF